LVLVLASFLVLVSLLVLVLAAGLPTRSVVIFPPEHGAVENRAFGVISPGIDVPTRPCFNVL